MPNDHPFQQLFETFGKLPKAHSDSVNREARETMKGWLKIPLESSGHCLLLRAPRAGHGKTHLLTRLQYDLGGSHEFIPLHAIGGSRIDAATVLDDTLRRLIRSLPAAGGLTVFDLVARRLFSTSLQPLVNSGEVPCQDREGAINALRSRPIETFDFHHPGAVTAHWARDNFELLGPRLALELSQRNGLSLREVSFWVNAMFHFSATPIDNPGRVSALAATVFSNPSAEAVAHERLVALLGLLTSLMRIVLVADEIEGFSSDETAALRFASFIGTLRQSAERVDVILSVNEDIWESAFVPRLSGGLADRLSEVVVELEPLDREGMIAIIESRSPGNGERIVNEMDAAPSHARGLIKQAAETAENGDKPKKQVVAAPAEMKKEQPVSAFSAPAAPTPEAPKQEAPEPEAPKEEEKESPKQEELKQEEPKIPTENPFAKMPETRAEEPTPAHSESPAHPEVPAPLFGAAPISDEPLASPPKPDFSAAPVEKAEEPEQVPSASSAPIDSPPSSMFSAEAAIAAFAAAPKSDSDLFSSGIESEEESSKFTEKTEQPASWPSPEVAGSSFVAAPEKKEEAAPAFQAPAEESAFFAAPEEPKEQPASAFQAPPAAEEKPSMFANPASTFQTPPVPDQESVSAFQAPPSAPIQPEPPAFQAPPAPTEKPVFQVAPEPAESPASAFQAPAPPPLQQEPPAFQAAPEPAESPASAFQVPAPAPLPPEPPAFQVNPVAPEPPAFQAAPEPAESSASAFQAPAPPPQQPEPPAFQVNPVASEPPAPAAEEPKSDSSTDRVDDLLRQFRERYGKG